MSEIIEELKARIAKLEAENAELTATVWLLKHDLDAMGPENVRLSNAYNAARVEIVRLTTKNARGRPKKDYAGSYEEYLFRETIQTVVESLRNGGKKICERKASVIADAKIRKTAQSLQDADMPGAFIGIAANYPATEQSIYNAFRRAKRQAGFTRQIQTKK